MTLSEARVRLADRRPDAVIVGSQGVRLAAYRDGDVHRPVLVFVHGFPDTAAVWDRLVEALAGDYCCVRYDVRGAGRSEAPASSSAYRLSHLKTDLVAVLDWAAPKSQPVHLIGHDWGSIQSWEAATDPALASRLASFTSLSGPCLDHIGHALRDLWHRDCAALARQARRSWYVALFQIPGLAEFGWRRLMAPRWAQTLARLEGHALPVADTLRADGVHGIRLYRANVASRLMAPRIRRAAVPVHLIVAARDPFVGAGLAEGARPWVDRLTVSTLDAGHWAIASRAETVAGLCRDYFDASAAASEPGP